MTDDTEALRMAMVPAMPAALEAAQHAGERVWDTQALQEEFEVLAFLAPLVVVRRKADGAKGALTFTHAPRYYFGWVADPS